MKTWHVSSGGVQLSVNAETVEDAFAEAVRQSPLDQFNKLICAYEDGTSFFDGTTMWGITEWYLPQAGYEAIEPHLWRKKQEPEEFSSGIAGSNRGEGKSARISSPSAPAPTSKTVSTPRAFEAGWEARGDSIGEETDTRFIEKIKGEGIYTAPNPTGQD